MWHEAYTQILKLYSPSGTDTKNQSTQALKVAQRFSIGVTYIFFAQQNQQNRINIPWYKMINYYDLAVFMVEHIFTINMVYIYHWIVKLFSNRPSLSIYFTLCTQFLFLSHSTNTHSHSHRRHTHRSRNWKKKNRKFWLQKL